jgi:hypothetical protein
VVEDRKKIPSSIKMASSVNSFKNRYKNTEWTWCHLKETRELEKEASVWSTPGQRNSLRGLTSYLGHWKFTHNNKNNNYIITEASKLIKIKVSPQTPIVGEKNTWRLGSIA